MWAGLFQWWGSSRVKVPRFKRASSSVFLIYLLECFTASNRIPLTAELIIEVTCWTVSRMVAVQHWCPYVLVSLNLFTFSLRAAASLRGRRAFTTWDDKSESEGANVTQTSPCSWAFHVRLHRRSCGGLTRRLPRSRCAPWRLLFSLFCLRAPRRHRNYILCI